VAGDVPRRWGETVNALHVAELRNYHSCGSTLALDIHASERVS
jgi:hypothetical protein